MIGTARGRAPKHLTDLPLPDRPSNVSRWSTAASVPSMSAIGNSFRLDERELQASALRSQVLERCRRTLVHDINNAVQGIHSGFELLTKYIRSPGNTHVSADDCIALLHQQLTTLRRTLDRIVAEAAEPPGKPQRFDLAVLTSDVLRSLRHERAVERARTRIEPGAFVYARRVNVRSFAAALILDAIDHLDRDGIIEITVRRHERDAVLEIRAPFPVGAAAAAPRPVPQMVGHLLALEQGALHVDSAGEQFAMTMRLPLCERELDETAQTQRDKPVRVLIADRNRDAADSLATILRLDGMETQALYTGTHLAATLQHFQPDIAFLDADLPDCDIRAIARTVIATSGRRPLLVQVSSNEEIKHEEFDVHLLRPLEWSQLHALVQRARS